MKSVFIICLSFLFQSPAVVVKHNGDEVNIKNALIYQSEGGGSPSQLSYAYRGVSSQIALSQVKRISFKEVVSKKKGITTYRVVLVKKNNDKMEVTMDLSRLEGVGQNGKKESMNFSSIDKISF